MATNTCPVCDEPMAAAGVQVMAEDQEITVCCEECAQEVRTNPTEYADASDSD